LFSYFFVELYSALDFSRAEMSSRLLPSGLDELHALWDALSVIELLLSVTWHVSVSGVVDVLGRVEVGWEVEVVELSGIEINVVLNTITIGIEDLVVVGLETGLEEIELMQVLGAGKDHSPVSNALFGLEERLL
jgi:hypothetical protein